MSDTPAPEEPTPEQVKSRKVEAFAGRDTRHARLAEALLGADDPVFAIASLLVDHEARLDLLVDRCGRLEFRLIQMKDRSDAR